MATRLRRCALCVPVLLSLCLGGCALGVGDAPVTVQFEEADGLVLNPDCGWVAYNYEDSYAMRTRVAGGEEPFPFASVVYTRHPRRAWDGPNGGFEGSAPLALLEDWMANGRHVAFRVYANGPDELPDKLRERVPVFTYARDGETGQGIHYWAESYVEDHRRLVEFLGERLGDSPYLAYVDIGGVGNTGGEWCFSVRKPFTAAGLDDQTHFELARAFVEMYRKAFPHTRLIISYECVAKAWSKRLEMMTLLSENDVGVRDDGLGGWPYPQQAPSRATWPMPAFWPDVPVVFECGGKPGGVYGWTVQQKAPPRILDWAFEQAHPSYVNIGGAETASARACSELPELLLEYGRRLGYRFVLLGASRPRTSSAGTPLLLETTWANRGVAPCYADRLLELSLSDADGALAAKALASPEPRTSQWVPGRTVRVRADFRLPEDLSPGRYVLKLRMLLGDPRDPDASVAIASRGGDAEGRFDLGVLQVE